MNRLKYAHHTHSAGNTHNVNKKQKQTKMEIIPCEANWSSMEWIERAFERFSNIFVVEFGIHWISRNNLIRCSISCNLQKVIRSIKRFEWNSFHNSGWIKVHSLKGFFPDSNQIYLICGEFNLTDCTCTLVCIKYSEQTSIFITS